MADAAPDGSFSASAGEGEGRMAGALRIAVTRLTRRLRAERADHSLTLSQISALSSLDHHGPLSPTALAELERVQPPSMTRVISALEHRAFAIRAPHHSDRRRSVIAITDKGKSVLEENRRRRDAWLAKVLEELSPDERQALARAIPVLERIGRF